MKKQENSTWKTLKKIRGDWGAVSPVTRIIPNKKKQKRHPKHKGQSYD